MTHPKVSEVIQYPLLHTIIGPNTFSVVKATLQLQMSVCPSVSLSVSLKSKPLSLSESCPSAKSQPIVKLGSLVSHTEWSNISERNSKLIGNLKKGTEL